jgi:hypothetical protein
MYFIYVTLSGRVEDREKRDVCGSISTVYVATAEVKDCSNVKEKERDKTTTMLTEKENQSNAGIFGGVYLETDTKQNAWGTDQTNTKHSNAVKEGWRKRREKEGRRNGKTAVQRLLRKENFSLGLFGRTTRRCVWPNSLFGSKQIDNLPYEVFGDHGRCLWLPANHTLDLGPIEPFGFIGE